MTKASANEFKKQRNPLPGDRKKVAAVGPYVLELYEDPMGQRPRTVIEINKKHDDGNYGKVSSLWFNTQDADERQFDDPESAAHEAFDTLKNSQSEVESHL